MQRDKEGAPWGRRRDPEDKDMKRTIQALTAFLLLPIFLLAGGCSVSRFRQPEEEAKETVKPAPQDEQKEEEQTVYQADALVYEKQLDLPSGGVAATYRAALPQFKEEGSQGLILRKINEYYETELVSLQQDCESYFGQIQASYGNGWQTAVQPVADYHVDFSYELVQQSGGRISVVRTYRYVDTNVKDKVVYTAETFDCQTGWPEKLQDLFTGDKEKVQQAVIEQIEKWCGDNGLEYSQLTPFTFEKQDSSFAISQDTLYLCMEESAISSQSAGGQLVQIPLENLEDVLA